MDISPTDEAPQAAPARHTALGIASFVLVFVIWTGGFGLLVAIAVIGASAPDNLDESSPVAGVLGMLYLCLVLGTLVGLALAVAGLVQKDRLKVFAILGVAFHALTFLGLVGLILLSAAVS
jgi:hypothetical protein